MIALNILIELISCVSVFDLLPQQDHWLSLEVNSLDFLEHLKLLFYFQAFLMVGFMFGSTNAVESATNLLLKQLMLSPDVCSCEKPEDFY